MVILNYPAARKQCQQRRMFQSVLIILSAAIQLVSSKKKVESADTGFIVCKKVKALGPENVPFFIG